MSYSAYSRITASSCFYKTGYRKLENGFGFNSVKEMTEFLYFNFYQDIKYLLDNSLSPSVDRINTSIGYTPSNIRIISHKENTELGLENRRKKILVEFKDGSSITFNSVSDCVEYFGFNRNSSSKVNSWAKQDGKYKIPNNVSQVLYL